MKWIIHHKQAILDHSFLAIFFVLPFVDLLSPIALGVCLVLALFFGSKKDLALKLKNKPQLLLLILYFLLAIISLSYTIDIGKTSGKIGKHIAFLLIPITFVLVNPNQLLLKKAKHIFIISCVIFCGFSLLKLGYNYLVRAHENHWYNFVQESMYHKYMPEDAMYLNTALIFLLFGNFKKYFKLGIAFLFLVVIVLFGVRLGLFLYFLILAIYVFKNMRLFLNYKTLIVVAIGVVVMGFLIKSSTYVNDKFFDTLDKIGFNTEKNVSEIGEQYHDISLRTKIWNAAIEVIKEKPLLGYGGGAEKTILNTVYTRERLYSLLGFHAHNQLLSSTIQYGFLGIGVLFFIYFFSLKRILKQGHLVHCILVMLMIISMSTESYLELQQGTFYFCIFISLMAIEETRKHVI
jgi:O-antigen ligase